MATIRLKGKLEKWFDDKGFGFITPENGAQDIFVHIYAFGKALSRRPMVGDTIYYNVHTDKNGKIKAIDAIIEGVRLRRKAQTSGPTKHYNKRGTNTSLLTILLCSVFFIGIGNSIYSKLQSGSDRQPEANSQLINSLENPLGTQQPVPRYSCEGKIHCSEMTSCGEAQFYLRNCPGTKIDGDSDGVPCESQWCD